MGSEMCIRDRTGTVKVSWSVELTIVLLRVEAGGTQQMTAVRGGALLNIPAKRQRVTVNQTMTVSTLAGPSVAMTCVSTPNTSPQRSIPTTQLGLDSLAQTIAATESATRTTTDVEMELLDVKIMQTVEMNITAKLIWTNQLVMN